MAGLFMVKQTIDIGEFGNPLLNVYGFRSSLAILDELNELLNAFETTMLPLWANLCSSDANTIQLEAYKLNTTGYQNRILGTPVPGVWTGTTAAPFIAWSFKLQRAAIGDRSGGKRIGQISQASFADRAPVAGILTDIAAFAAGYGSPLNVGLIQQWFPVILERPHGAVTTWGDHASAGATFDGLSTQNTRKK